MTELLKKIEKKLSKVRYLTEAIFVIICLFFLVQLICTKKYNGYFHKLYLLGTMIYLSISVINIIYNFIKDKHRIERLFINIAIPIGLCFAIFMIPGHVPDENTHFYKAYDISCGNLITKIDANGESFITVPKDLVNYNKALNNYYSLRELASTQTNYKDTQKVISTAQGNSFITYIFSAIAFFIVRILNIPIFYGIILGRLFNLSFYIFMLYLAIKKIPFGKKVLAIYALMPMCIQQASSFSPDAVINAILLYYIAHSIYLIFKKEKISIRELLIYIILTPIIGIIKMVYILIAGVGFLIIKRKDIAKKTKVAIIAITILLGSTALFGMLILSPKYEMVPESTKEYMKNMNVDSSKQIQTMISSPKHVIKAFIYDYYNMGNYYINSAIGSELGWLEINPAQIVITAYLILLLASILFEEHKYQFNLKNALWIILIVLGVMTLTQIALYVGFTPIGAEFIGGIQGRYYIPTYILLLLCLCRKKYNLCTTNSEIKLICISSILNILIIFEMMKYFI